MINKCFLVHISVYSLEISYPDSATCSQCIVFDCVPFEPHDAEHLLHLLSAHRGGHDDLPHRWLSDGFVVLSHRPSSTCSNVERLLQVTLLVWNPPPHSDEHSPNGPCVQAYVSCSNWANSSGTLYSYLMPTFTS